MLAGIMALFKALAIALGLIQEERQTQRGIDLQSGQNAKDALNDARQDIAARDAVVPLRPDGLRLDGTRDPGQRD